MSAEIVLNIVLVYTLLAAMGAVIIFFVLLQSEDKIFTNMANNIRKAKANWRVLDKAKKLRIKLMLVALFVVATLGAVFVYQYKKPIAIVENFQAYNRKAVNGEELMSFEQLTCDVSVDVEIERLWSGDYEAYGTITIGDDNYSGERGFVYPYFLDEDGYSIYFTMYSSDDGWIHLNIMIEKVQGEYELVYALVEPGDKFDSEYIGPAESVEEAKKVGKVD